MSRQSTLQRNMHIVLVHGAWADGSGWAKVITPLTADGFAVTAAPLPLTSYADDVEALEHALGRIEKPVVLAGHAYAGAVIAGVQSEKVKALVYVAALAPDEGETVADVFHRVEPDLRAPQLAPDDSGLIYYPTEAFATAYAQNATADDLAVLSAVQRPMSPACIMAPVCRPLWKDRPSWFLVAEDDRMIAAVNQRFMAERMQATQRAFAVDHTPMITAPEVVLQVIREAAASVTEA